MLSVQKMEKTWFGCGCFQITRHLDVSAVLVVVLVVLLVLVVVVVVVVAILLVLLVLLSCHSLYHHCCFTPVVHKLT